MADTATATAPVPAPAPDAAATAADKKKPEKPNAELFNERLAKAEKEYQDSMAKYVCRGTHLSVFSFGPALCS